MTLKEIYNNSISPNMVRVKDNNLWDRVNSNTVMDLFQFNSGVGLEALHKIQPKNVIELASANAAMRLVTEKGKETPVDRFARFRNNIQLWYDEVKRYNLSEREIKILEPLYLPYSGCIFLQESLMLVLMDKNICGFSLADANKARKVVSKKNLKQIPWLQEKIYSSIENKNFADYIWDTAIKPQLSYAFSLPHCLGYGLVALQEAQLTLDYPQVYWNTACLNVNASTSDEIEFEEDYGENELLDEEEFGAEEKSKKAQNVNYDKIAKALGEVIKAGIVAIPPLINSSSKDFEPDVENNRILYSLKALAGVGDNEIEQIIQNRPYASLEDFLEKTRIKKPAVISLIKAGAFDEFGKDRTEIMRDYIIRISDTKKVLNMRNFQALLRNNLLPKELEYQCRLFEFNRYIRQRQFKIGSVLLLDARAQDFMLQNYPDFYDAGVLKDNFIEIKEKDWKKTYDKEMLKAKQYIIDNQEELLEKYNNILINEQRKKYCLGSISKWEMDSMSFYYHKHELADIDLNKYGISKFSELPEEPIVDRIFEIKGRQIPIYKIEKIIGTCIGKNNMKNTFTLLTSDGEVVDIRLTKEHFAYYNKQISEMVDGTKKVREKSWFTRGTKLMVVGIRRGGGFMAKKYKSTGGHRLYKITEVINDGTEMLLTSSRYGAE